MELPLLLELAAYVVVGFGIVGVTGCAIVLTTFIYAFSVATWRNK